MFFDSPHVDLCILLFYDNANKKPEYSPPNNPSLCFFFIKKKGSSFCKSIPDDNVPHMGQMGHRDRESGSFSAQTQKVQMTTFRLQI